jgi:hypothetical protein
MGICHSNGAQSAPSKGSHSDVVCKHKHFHNQQKTASVHEIIPPDDNEDIDDETAAPFKIIVLSPSNIQPVVTVSKNSKNSRSGPIPSTPSDRSRCIESKSNDQQENTHDDIIEEITTQQIIIGIDADECKENDTQCCETDDHQKYFNTTITTITRVSESAEIEIIIMTAGCEHDHTKSSRHPSTVIIEPISSPSTITQAPQISVVS